MLDADGYAIIASDQTIRSRIISTLERFGPGAVGRANAAGVRIVALRPQQRYDDASSVLRRMGVDVDAWSAPPAGLFVLEERTVYLRSASPMTVAHEFAHALDCALGDGTYYSARCAEVRRAFASARAYVTPYAASAIDEYFAESVRAFVEINDPLSPWPRATRARLRRLDPAIAAIIEQLFRDVLAPSGAGTLSPEDSSPDSGSLAETSPYSRT